MFYQVTWETALFLSFNKCHLLADTRFTFSFSLSAGFVQTYTKIGPNFALVELFMEQKNIDK